MFGKKKNTKSEKGDLTKEHEEIIKFLREEEIKFLEIEDTEGELLEEFDDFIKEKLNLTNAIKWRNENFLEFIKKMNKLGASFFYISSPFVLEEHFEEPEEFKSQKILSKHEGETPFIIVF
jgi:arginine deiminase